MNTVQDNTSDRPSITLLHATPVAVGPVHDSLARLWPEADAWDLLDFGLTLERSRTKDLEERLVERFVRLVEYAESTRPAGILITCSAFGPAIDRAIAQSQTPIVKPNEAMFVDALDAGSRTGMVATFAPSVDPMTEEYGNLAARRSPGATLRTVVADGAMDALRAGDSATHHRLVADAAERLTDCDAVVLAHFSTAPAAEAVSARVSVPVFSAPDSAVLAIRHLVQAAGTPEGS